MAKGGAKTDQPDWSDLRVALHVGREGSVRQAARSLGLSHSTVLRRLRALEGAVGAELFVDRGGGYEATPAGQELLETAAEVESAVLALDRRVSGRDQRPVGPVRLTMPDPFAPALMPALAELSRAHPGIEVTVQLGTDYADLAHRAADVAVRTVGEPPPELVGRRVGVAAVGIYGSSAYLEGRPTDDLERLEWVGWEQGSTMFFARWMAQHVPGARVALRVSAAWGVREGVDAGLGVAIVPCALGEALPGWRRVALVDGVAAPLWILTHHDLRNTSRVRVVREFLADAIRARRHLFEGGSPA